MKNNQSDLEFEANRLEQTISIAKNQLKKARQSNEDNKSAIIAAKQELRENTQHSIGNLWSSDGFEALAALSQFANPVTEKLTEYEAIQNKIAILENLIKSPYFARIDFKYENEDLFEKIYIGRSSLMEGYEMHVYDWRSPIASVFYRFTSGQAFYDAPGGRIDGELNLKRQYEINNSSLEYFFDSDIQIIDEFLRKLLSQNTSSKMKTIVETIQKEQDIVIRDMENDLMMVQGAAGSGKTSIALHRAAYLMYQGLSSKLSSSNIMIISPNSLFEQYISNVLPELGEENVASVVLEDILKTVTKNKHIQTKNQFLEKLITDGRRYNIMKNSIEFKTSHQFIEILNRFIDDLPDKWLGFDDVKYGGYCIVSKELIKDKILMGRKGVPLGMRLKQIEEFILETVKEFHKQHANKAEYFRIKKEIRNFAEINTRELYNKLFSDRNYFFGLAKALELPDCVQNIFEFTRDCLSSNNLFYDDVSVLAFLELKLKGSKVYKNIKQVVIDEAQDYYPLHYEIFNLLFPGAKYTVLGDINQTLEKQEDLSLYEQISKSLNKKRKTLVTMDKSFRCTNEILVFSSKFIQGGAEIKSFNRKGREPEIHSAPDEASYCDMIVSEVSACIEDGYGSIGLICKTEKNSRSLFQRLKDRIDVRLIKDGSASDLKGIFIIPVYMSKGLEFDAVLLCDADNENYNSEEDKKLLYIACTRALHRLNVFIEGEASSLL